MADLPEYRIYISSTIDDLVAERAAAIDILRGFGLVKDSYRAADQGTVANCIADVHGAQLYVGIIGHRYGWVPDGEADPQAKSITELEYDACRSVPSPGRAVPRLMFLRTNSDDSQRDSKNRPATAARIEAFRTTLASGVACQCFTFNSLAGLEKALLQALPEQRAEFLGRRSAVMQSEAAWQARLHPVALLGLAGDGLPQLQALAALRPDWLRAHGLRPASGDLALQLDLALRGDGQQVNGAQLGLLVLTASSLQRLGEPGLDSRIRALLQRWSRRGDCLALLLVDLTPAALPADWPALPLVQVSQAELGQADAAAQVLARLGQVLPRELSARVRLALPALVIAPNAGEVAGLQAAGNTTFAPFGALRQERARQWKLLTAAVRKHQPAWPQGSHHDQRDGWRCFGSDQPGARALLEQEVRAINQAAKGSRERELLPDARLLLRHYSLDEYLHDEDGSRAMVLALRQRGCLILVDETALLLPALRAAATELVAAPRCAVAALCASDPAQLPSAQLFGEGSHLHLGALAARFAAELDPQCELGVNSLQRLQRWLRSAVPRLLRDNDGALGRPLHADQAETLLDDAP